MTRAFLALSVALLLAGCNSTPSKDDRSAAITQGGDASIEVWRHRVLPFTDEWTMIRHLDGVFPSTGRGVFRLTPGLHQLDLAAFFSRHTLVHWYIDTGETKTTLTALPGHRYRVLATAFDPTIGAIWIEDVTTGKSVTERLPIVLQTTEQQPPPMIFVPIPVK